MLFAAHPRKHQLAGIALAVVCASWLWMPQQLAAQNGPDLPDATISLAPLGYQPAPSITVITRGSSVHSLNYVDEHHLLLTWNARTLIHRMPGDSDDDSPQNMHVALLELPSGKVLAKAEWRLSDHAQYLWPVGEGIFLLRVGRELRLLTPLAESNPEEALQGKKLTTLPGPESLITVAPDGRMVLLEADVAKRSPAEDAAAAAAANTSPIGTPLGNMQQTPPPPVDQTTDVQFLEFDLSRQAQGVIHVSRVGHITAPSPLTIPLIHDGYIHANEGYPDDWDLIYTQLSGKDTMLGDVVSTCRPEAAFLSNSEVLVETCNGHDTAMILTVVTLGKKELWQHTLDDPGTEPSLYTTPASGRFAISRVLINGISSPGVNTTGQDDSHLQRIDVMDTQSGALVARVNAAPAERAGQNFSLSADGRHLAVLQNTAIAIYDLAPMQDFPAAPIKPKDLVFVAAPEGTPVPAPASAAAAVTAAVAAPAVIEVPLNVDAQRAAPTLLTPEEKRSVEGKKNKQITIQPPDPPPAEPKKPKQSQPQYQQ